MAIFRGSYEMAMHLVSRGANPGRLDGRGCSMLHLLASNQNFYNTLIPVPRILFQWCFHGSVENALDRTRLMVKMVTSAGVDVDFKRKVKNTDQWNTPLQDAINNKDAVAVLVLLEAGADPNIIEGYSGRSPLHEWCSIDMRFIAYLQAYFDALKLLMARSRNLGARDLDGETLIHAALPGVDAQKQSDFNLWKRKLEILLRHSEDLGIDDRDRTGMTLLLQVVMHRNIPRWNPLNAVKYLRGLGADITATNGYGADFLWHIGNRSDLREEVVMSATEMWLALFPGKSKAKILNQSKSSKNGKTYLMRISANGFAKCVKLALEHAADVNLTSADGYTALDYAVEAGNTTRLNIMAQYWKFFNEWPRASDIYHEDVFRDQMHDGGSGEGYLDYDASRDNQEKYYALPKIRDMLLNEGGKTGKQLGTSKYAPDVKIAEKLSLEAMEVWDTFQRDDQPHYEIWKASYDLDDD